MHKFKKLTAKKMDGENYYSIHYLDETDGEIHIGFSSFGLDVISEFLKEYFIDNQEKHAHWIVSYQGKTKKILICSRCGKSTAFDLDNKNKNEFQYCPICGAKMNKKL